MSQLDNLLTSAWRFLKSDNTDLAMNFAKKAHAINPNSPDVAHLLGLLASRDGKPEIALPLLQKSIDLGGKTSRKLKDMAEALLTAGYPEAALNPIQDAITEFGESTDLLGLKSAIEIALTQWNNAESTAKKAIELNKNLVAWEMNLSFCQLMQSNFEDGFKNATARPESLKLGSCCPVLMFATPNTIWIKSEQGIGDSLFYLRFVPFLFDKGWQFHLEIDRKLIPLLEKTKLFLSVKEKNPPPKNQVCFKVGDLGLMAMQCGLKQMPSPLRLEPDKELIDKYKIELSKFGPPPYVAVSWRAGPKGKKHRSGVRSLEKVIDPTQLAKSLSNTDFTVINIQRLPTVEELNAFNISLARKSVDFSALNNNLSGMLALLSIVDNYLTVPNTNLHLREGLARPSKVFVNRPFQDWRWQANGDASIWYPNSIVYRQEKDKTWGNSIAAGIESILNGQVKIKEIKSKGESTSAPAGILKNKLQFDENDLQIINEGWSVVSDDIPKAISNAKSVLSKNPYHPRALHLLGWAAVQDLKFDLGISILKEAVKHEPNNGNIWRDYIRAHVLTDKCNDAIDLGKTCLKNKNVWARGVVYFALGVAYGGLGDFKLALENYEKCLTLIPSHIDAMSAAGMIRLSLNENIRLGFRYLTNRQEARNPAFFPIWVCPVLKGNLDGLKILIIRMMGLGDELLFLRYLPYLIRAGAKVTYWSGAKLAPILNRTYPNLEVVPDSEPMPSVEHFDLTFIKDELPVAVEHLNAPEIPDPIPLTLDEKKLTYWKNYLSEQGNAPFIGVTWKAGVGGVVKDSFGFTRLSKKVELVDFANALSGLNGTFISLQRNITKDELNDFEKLLGCHIVDLAGTTDDLDDLLCIQKLLDENIGVSNTNMHLRASLGLCSRVLIGSKNSDWRWSRQGNKSLWFKECQLYLENEIDGWKTALVKLRQDLITKYGLAQELTKPLLPHQNKPPVRSKKIVWFTAGEIKKGDNGYFSNLASAQERVVNVAKLLEAKGWQSVFLIESVSELMGGWHDKLPVKGDVVVFSKVFTDHSINMMHDAKARGATVIVDVFNDFESQPARALQQQKMMQAADVVVSSPKLQLKWQRLKQAIAFYYDDINEKRTAQQIDQATQDWLALLENPNSMRYKQNNVQNVAINPTETDNHRSALTKRLVWLTGGDIQNNQGELSSDLASTRYRVITPAKALEQNGWKSQIVNEATSKKLGQWGIEPPQAGDTVIVSKVFSEHALSLAYDAKSRGAYIVVDLCDNHLSHPQRGALQKALLDMSDLIVTSTQALNEALAQVGKQADAVISDPVEFKRGEIKFAPNHTVKLVWFGHSVNIDTVIQTMPALAKLGQTTPLQLNIVTTLPNGQQDLDKITPAGLSATYTPWSVSATEAAIAECDMVIIPTLQSDNKNAKSPNRLLEPLWAGRMVVAGPLPAYLHFADSAWVGKDIVEGITWCLANPHEVKKRIAQGQADVEKYFTAQAIGQQWHDVLSKTASQDKVAATALRPEAAKNSPSPVLKELAILTTQHPTLPSIAIRLIEPLAALEDYSVKLASGIQHQKLVIDYETLLMRDIIVVQRDFPSTDTLPLLKKLKTLGKKLVYETDDAFHLIPESHSKAFHRAKAPAIFEFAKLADAITVSTEALAKEFKPHGKVTVVPNRLSPTLWNEALIQQRDQKRASLSGNLRIGLIGGSDHQHDLAMLAEVITTLQQQYPTLEWVAYGDGASQLLKQHISPPQVTITPSNFDYRGHPTRLAEMAIDIALIPLVDDAFNACRSNLKYLELGFLGVAGIFSNTASYNKSVIDGETGLLANNATESWLNAIHQLIEDPALREKIAANAKKDVTKHGIFTSHQSGWQALLDKLK